LSLPGDWIPKVAKERGGFPFIDEFDLGPPDPDEIARVTAAEMEAAVEALHMPDDWIPQRLMATTRTQHGLKPEQSDTGAEAAGELTNGMAEHKQLEADPEVSVAPTIEKHLPFVAALVPQDPQHELSGELNTSIRTWLERFCAAWDWQADAIVLHPDHLYFHLYLPSDVAPSWALQRLRDDLSQRILTAYPQFAGELGTEPFWAENFLLTTLNPLTKQRVKTFIAETRRA
jgi:REP element-mobilizing transposase RayT